MPPYKRAYKSSKPKRAYVSRSSAMYRSRGGYAANRVVTRVAKKNQLATTQSWHNSYATGTAPLSFDIYYTGSVWANTKVGGPGNGSFTLDRLSNYTAWTALFDQYRIKKVTLNFEPSYNVGDAQVAAAQTSGKGMIPTLLIAKDVDGQAIAPAAESQLLNYPGVKKLYMDRPRSFSFVPRISMLGYANNMSGVGYPIGKYGQWIDSNNPDVPHYGILWFLDTGATSSTNAGLGTDWTCKVYVKYELEFKDVY